MKYLQPVDQLIAKLQAPTQSVTQLSFCDASRDGYSKWVNSLPLTQTQYVGTLLYKALPEISWLQTTASNRITLLEALRAPTVQVIEGLSKSFLNQPLILPEEAIKTATIAQALQKHLNNGYIATIRDLCSSASPKKHLLTLSLHRAIMGMGLLLFRYYQLNLPVPIKLWSDIHSLYQLAIHYELLDETVTEPLLHHQNCCTVKLAYMRILLLACSRPNQLRQNELIVTYEALNGLTHLAQLTEDEPSTNKANLLSVAIDSNQAPNYRSRLKEMGHPFLLVLNTYHIIKRLESLGQQPSDDMAEANVRRNELDLTYALTEHLIQAWDLLPQRSLDRQPTAGSLNITVGISSIHYHLAGGTTFADFLGDAYQPQQNQGIPSLFQNRHFGQDKPDTKNVDPLDELDELDELDAAPVKDIPLSNEAYPVYEVPLIDTSPGGYCIEWRDEIPNQVKAGELLGLLDPVRNYWSLGVVRWANLTQGATQLGIQILAPQAIPVAVALLQKSGDNSEFLRALELPQNNALNQAPTLITNTVSFRDQSRAVIYHRPAKGSDTETNPKQNIQFASRIFATGTFNQFNYQYLAPAEPTQKTPAAQKSTLFDPEWDA